MELETVYNMAASAARGADQMCGHEGGSVPVRCSGYPHYISEYNRLLKFAAELDPTVATLFEPIDLGRHSDSYGLPLVLLASYAEQTTVALHSLASYLQSKLGKKQQEYEKILG